MAESKKLSLTFWSGVRTVTGANFMLESDAAKILIDCGLIQGTIDAEKRNHDVFPYDPASVDVLIVTHAHIDHIGRIPNLVKAGFKGTIFSTPETKAITEFMLEDLLRVRQKNFHDIEPPFTEDHIRQALGMWQTFPYHQTFEPVKGFTAEFLDAGHILGSAMIKIGHAGKHIIFTGDTGNSPSPLIRDTEHLTGADYLVIDSVYGDRNHESKAERDQRFAEVVKGSIERKGTLIIPTFSLERAQILLYELDKLVESGAIPAVPVFLDSPLAIKLTAIYKKSAELFKPSVAAEMRGDDIFNFSKLKFSFSGYDSAGIAKVADPKIIIAGSGMSAGGRVMGHEALYLPHENNTVLLTGYQAVGTLGRLLEEGQKEVEINGVKVPVRARIEAIHGYSGHRDSEGLLSLVATAADTLKKVFVVMGEPKSALFLVQRIRDYLDIEAMYPEEGKKYTIMWYV